VTRRATVRLLSVRSSGGKGESVKGAAHPALQRRIDQLVLRHARLAAEILGDDFRLPMVIVAGKIGQRDPGVGKRLTQKGLERCSIHGHWLFPPWKRPPATLSAAIQCLSRGCI